MTPSNPQVVTVILKNGKPDTSPDAIECKPGQQIEFRKGPGVTEFKLDFKEPPGTGPKEWFKSEGGVVAITIRQIDTEKYKGSDKLKWKRIKFDVVIGRDRTDPEVIIDPN